MIGLFSMFIFKFIKSRETWMCFIITSLQCGDINKEQNTVRIQMEINRHNRGVCHLFFPCTSTLKATINYIVYKPMVEIRQHDNA